MRPLLKWSGGKRSEIPFLKASYPKGALRVVEPFSGGAAVSFDLNPDRIVLNDLSKGLVDFYRTMKDGKKRASMVKCIALLDQSRKRMAQSVEGLSRKDLDRVFAAPGEWIQEQSPAWFAGLPADLAGLAAKDVAKSTVSKTVDRIPKLEKKAAVVFDERQRRDHLETGLQAGLYTAMRRLYNHEIPVAAAWSTAAWWFVRSLCYSGMFRYARNGKFNVPYGGIGYNTRDFAPSVEQLSSPEVVDFFQRADVNDMDFEALLDHYQFGEGDFVFVDPPYDSAFSQYNPEMDFARQDQERLARALIGTRAPWMLVVKNTPFILSLYQDKGLHLGVFDKTYQANFRNRHARDAEHLVVTNYPFAYAAPGEVGIQELVP